MEQANEQISILELIEEKKFDEIFSKYILFLNFMLQEEFTFNGIVILKENTQNFIKKMKE